MNIAYAQTNPLQKVSVQTSTFDAILSASPVVQLTLIALLGLSVVCWAVIFMKRKQYNDIANTNQKFLDLFWKTTSLDTLNERVSEFKESTLAHVFEAGFQELRRIAESELSDKKNSSKAESLPKLQGIDNLARTLQRAGDLEIAKIEKNLNILATTGSTGPFIGLFGTVWGIMGAFHKIGASGSASLAVVAPGISEALIATAIGLAAAIPAVMAYNHFLTKLKKEELEIDGFKSDFLNITKRNFFKGE